MLVTIKVAPISSHKRANHSPSVSPNSNLEFSHSLPMEFGEMLLCTRSVDNKNGGH